SGELPERQLEHRGHPVGRGEDVLGGRGGGPVRRNDVVGSGRGRIGFARPYPDMLVTADNVFDQVTNRPLRGGRWAAELLGADVGEDAGERSLGALVSNKSIHEKPPPAFLSLSSEVARIAAQRFDG